MKNRIIILCIIVVSAILLIFYAKSEMDFEISSFEEISKKEEKDVIINLFYKNKDEVDIICKTIPIDYSLLISNPYYEILKKLKEGSDDEKYISILKQNTKINDCFLCNDCVIIDLSIDSRETILREEKENYLLIKSLWLTMTQFTEVSSIRVLFDGEENEVISNIIKQLESP